MITLTDKGAEKVHEFLASQRTRDRHRRSARRCARRRLLGLPVRARLRPGAATTTIVFEDKGIRLLIDKPSLPYVQGSVIDYIDEMQGAGFKVDNPNVVAACGCGSSFRVAEEEEGRGLGGLIPEEAGVLTRRHCATCHRVRAPTCARRRGPT